ncbi:DUF6809 family protein [uncultured Intestinimonas sp.]|uniref:DUF6809 family protein n=1 Tax=uncultured Intestinimonas sp. TaxID=1689265 RepID=UPI0025E297EC|nr:DUF6809 family protein [uncultured Intestinimonas sp.]
MDSVIRDLFYGELDFSSDGFIQDPYYQEAMEKSHTTGEERKQFLRYLDAQSAIVGTLTVEYFSQGFRLAGRLMGEVFS